MKAPGQMFGKRLNFARAGSVLARLAPLSSILCFMCWFRFVDAKSPRIVSLALRPWLPGEAAGLLMFLFLAAAAGGAVVLFTSRRVALGAATLLPVAWVAFTLVAGWAV